MNTSSRRALVVSQTSVTPFGRKLVQMGIADNAQIQAAFETYRETGRDLVSVVSEMTGRELTPELQRLYKRQELFELKVIYGFPCLDLALEPAALEQVMALQETLLPVDVCNRYQMCPISQEGDVVTVAMTNPENLRALDDLNRRLRLQGLKLKRVVFGVGDFTQLLDDCLNQQAQSLASNNKLQDEEGYDDFYDDDDDDREESGEEEFDEEEIEVTGRLEDIDLDIEGLDDAVEEEGESLEAALRSAEGAPVIKLANQVMVKALKEGVSDIHIEPQEQYLRIRFRKDGVLRKGFDNLPKQIIPALTTRFKILAELDIAERRQPQDGRIRRMFKRRRIDFRVNTLPSRYGEKIVMRILDNSSTKLGLDVLISDPDVLAGVRDVIHRPFGLILVTGPTGSGKTTTLYSALAELNSPGINISTAEDPIEYSLKGTTQVQVIREKGMNFANILRAFLRQDPDVILVGETRDVETAKTAIEASLTGHLVLTTLHTNDAPGAIVRLTEMGVESFNISSALLGVLAQRLMRRVCGECKRPYHPSPEELARYGLVTVGSTEQITFFRANALTPPEIREARKAKTLCPKCKGVGYKGRVGVYEFMRMSDEIAKLINQGAPTEKLKEAAVEAGMDTLLTYSLKLVQQGMTTLDEVNRVVLTDKALESERKQRAKETGSCRSCGGELHVEWVTCPYCLTPRFDPVAEESDSPAGENPGFEHGHGFEQSSEPEAALAETS
ncbi:GspE/PulE family protein [Synechococcus sp. PCC 7336]|uniref:GspE/PulE family protein n=1 Tax=Synechococcus sp. PCC 7336 TaxID=195250 RepID=UPI000348F367